MKRVRSFSYSLLVLLILWTSLPSTTICNITMLSHSCRGCCHFHYSNPTRGHCITKHKSSTTIIVQRGLSLWLRTLWRNVFFHQHIDLVTLACLCTQMAITLIKLSLAQQNGNKHREVELWMCMNSQEGKKIPGFMTLCLTFSENELIPAYNRLWCRYGKLLLRYLGCLGDHQRAGPVKMPRY